MIEIRKSKDRGVTKLPWLTSYHTFSFGNYYDPRHLGFRSLVVINEDIIAPNKGFGTHPHKDMEIVTYVVKGSLAHRDSMGNTHIVPEGGVQYMCAGSGVSHSEFNPSLDAAAHIVQIWITPNAVGLAPAYQDLDAAPLRGSRAPVVVISPDGRDGSLRINQNTIVSVCDVEPGAVVANYQGHYVDFWVQLISGKLKVGSLVAESGDGVALSGENAATLEVVERSVFLLFGV